MRRRWVKRAALSFVAFLAILATASAALFLRLSEGPLSLDFMRERIQAQINQSLGGMKVHLAGIIIERDSQTGLPFFACETSNLLILTDRRLPARPRRQ